MNPDARRLAKPSPPPQMRRTERCRFYGLHTPDSGPKTFWMFGQVGLSRSIPRARAVPALNNTMAQAARRTERFTPKALPPG